MNALRHMILSACDALIAVMFIAAMLAYLFRWPIVVLAGISILAKVL